MDFQNTPYVTHAVPAVTLRMTFLVFAIDEASHAVGFALATFRASKERKSFSKEAVTFKASGGNCVAPVARQRGPTIGIVVHLADGTCINDSATICDFPFRIDGFGNIGKRKKSVDDFLNLGRVQGRLMMLEIGEDESKQFVWQCLEPGQCLFFVSGHTVRRE